MHPCSSTRLRRQEASSSSSQYPDSDTEGNTTAAAATTAGSGGAGTAAGVGTGATATAASSININININTADGGSKDKDKDGEEDGGDVDVVHGIARHLALCDDGILVLHVERLVLVSNEVTATGKLHPHALGALMLCLYTPSSSYLSPILLQLFTYFLLPSPVLLLLYSSPSPTLLPPFYSIPTLLPTLPNPLSSPPDHQVPLIHHHPRPHHQSTRC